jgi:disulfide bond formation protein DsbB
MTENRINPDIPGDDVDLIGLLERIYLFFRRFRNIFLIALVVGALLGGVVYFLSPKLYQSKLILHPAYLTNQEEIEIIDYWNQLLQRNERKILAPILNCSEELLNKVTSLEGAPILKNYSSTDPNGFYITATVSDNSILPQLQNAIIYGLNNTEYVKQKHSEKKQDLETLIDNTSYEAKKLDSLKNNMETSVDKNPVSALLNVETINKDLIDLNEKLVGYKTELRSLSSLQLLQGFIPLNTPISRSLKTSILLGVLFCVAIAYLFSLLKYVEDRLKKRVKLNA